MDATDNGTTDNAAVATPAPEARNLLNIAAAENTNTNTAQTVLGAAVNEPVVNATVTTADEFAWMPEKFRTKAEGSDSVSVELSAKKLAESYSFLEKRVGAGEARPESADGYTIKIDGLDWDAMKAAPGIGDVLKQAHDLGFNNKQLEFMVREVVSAQPTQAETTSGMTQAEAQAELQKTWADAGEYKRNMNQAVSAIRGLVPKEDQQGFMNRYGNDPAIVRMMARLGGEMSEDRLTLLGSPIESAESVDELMMSPAYRDPKDPKHAETVRRVRTYFQRQSGGSDTIV